MLNYSVAELRYNSDLSGWFPMRQYQLLHQSFSLNDHLLMTNGKGAEANDRNWEHM